MKSAETIRGAIDVGSKSHWVGIGLSEGTLLDEFEVCHDQRGFENFFRRVEVHRSRFKRPVLVAMEGYNGWARPLDSQIQRRGYTLFNVNNLKLARYKEIFTAPAKNDQIDARKMLELFHLRESLPLAKDVLQEVKERPDENQRLKRVTRRRRQLVQEKVRVVSRLQSDLKAVCPELTAITRSVTNRWFLLFLTSRKDLEKLARVRRCSLLKLKGIGPHYADIIESWQEVARFSSEVEWVGEMILADARRIRELLDQIDELEKQIAKITLESEIAQRLATLPGFGMICSAELAGEIGTFDRFSKEASLAVYLGMAVLDKSSGKYQASQPARHVNRRAKFAMSTAVARHLEKTPQSRTYYEKKRAEGKTHN